MMRMEHVDLKDLEIFYTVAQAGTMTGAAQRLGYVQSHITGRVRLLEREFRHPLFERGKTGVSLTPEGQKLYPYVESLLAQWNEMRSAMLESDGPCGTLRIGSLESTAALHAARWISTFHVAFPNVDISLETGTTKTLLQRVVDRKLDLVIIAGSVENLDLASKALMVEELKIITPIGKTPEEVLRSNPVMITFRDGCTYRRVLEQWTANRGYPMLRVMESANIDTILQLVVGGLGVSIMPNAIIEHSMWKDVLAAHPTDEDDRWVTTYAVWRRTPVVPRQISALLDQLSDGPETAPRHADPAVSVVGGKRPSAGRTR